MIMLKQQFREIEAKSSKGIYTPYCLLCCNETIKILFWDHMCNRRYALASKEPQLKSYKFFASLSDAVFISFLVR